MDWSFVPVMADSFRFPEERVMPETSYMRELETDAKGVLSRVSDGVCGLDRAWRYTYVNSAAAALLHSTPEQMLGSNIWSLFPDLVGHPFQRGIQRAFALQTVVFVDAYWEQTRAWFECRVYPSRDGVTLMFHDVTLRRRGEALQRGQAGILERIAHGGSLSATLTALLQLIEAQCPDMRCSILLLEGNVLRHGAAPSLPESYTGVIDGNQIGPAVGACGTAAFTGQPVISEDIATDPKWAGGFGDLALAHGLRACWSTPIIDDRGKVLGTFAMYYSEAMPPRERDVSVTELAVHIAAIAIGRARAEAERAEQDRVRQQYRELQESNRAVRDASRLKSEFLANMSHELRTPLNAINGFSEYLIDENAGPLTAKQSECLQHVLSSGRHLLRLVSDVLDLAKVEAGKLEMFPEECSLADMLSDVCAVASGLAREKEIALESLCDAKIDRVTLDVQKFKQVLFNLVSNAVKFTGEGGRIDVTAHALDAERFEVRVRDTGVGIRQEDLPKLFQQFQQLDGSASRRHEGTGLGLALAKRLVECQGGKIGVESEFGRGSTFFFALPRVLRARLSDAPVEERGPSERMRHEA
jgi:signal transduction histidine kinase/PAS domain-containing protein